MNKLELTTRGTSNRIPDSVLFAGAGKRPPKGKPASPGTANGFVDRARSSRMAVRSDTNMENSKINSVAVGVMPDM